MSDASGNLPKSYWKIGVIFIALSVMIAVLTFNAVWVRAIITIVPNTEKVDQELSFGVKELSGGESLPADTVNGRIFETTAEDSQKFAASGSKRTESDIVGDVIIYNTSAKDQDLIATTRLAAPEAPEKILVRLKKTVKILAGQSERVSVYADNPAAFTELKPMRFIIPGLWQPLQTKIYAENTQALSPDGAAIAVVTEADLQQAEKSLSEKLSQRALAQANEQAGGDQSIWPKLVSAQPAKAVFDRQAGDEAADFTATMTLKASVVTFDESQVLALMRQKFGAAQITGEPIINLDAKSFSYAITDVNLDNKTAAVKVNFTGDTIASAAELIDKGQIAGLDETAIKSYLAGFPQIKSAEVKFRPAWQKTAPTDEARIIIKVSR